MKLAEIQSIAAQTEDAYSYGRYGLVAWTSSIRTLANLGLTRGDIVIVLRSKVMRWAADSYGANDTALSHYIENHTRPLRGLGLRSAAGRSLG